MFEGLKEQIEYGKRYRHLEDLRSGIVNSALVGKSYYRCDLPFKLTEWEIMSLRAQGVQTNLLGLDNKNRYEFEWE
jgi:hypothetical protein